MKKNAKKKVFTLMLVIMLLSIVVVGGSLAWFTAEDDVTNNFTVGSIEVAIKEQQLKEVDSTGRPIYENYVNKDKIFMPIVDVDNPAADPNYQSKVVSVDNTGKNPAYVRVLFAVDSKLKDYIKLNFKSNQLWVDEGARLTSDGEYYVYTYYFNSRLNAPGNTGTILDGVYMDAKVDIKDNPQSESKNLEFCLLNADGSYSFSEFEIADENGDLLANTTIDVIVVSQAVQAEGFTTAKDALDRAFGPASDVTSDLFIAN